MRFLSLIFILISFPALSQLNADFSVVSTQGCSPFTVQFKDNSAGSPTSWFWDFGNGITSSLQNPSVTYTLSGNYSVRLIVRNSTNQDALEKTNYITVFATPEAHLQVISGDSGCVALQTSFQDTTDFFNALAKSWLWDFGDGNTSSQQNPVHTYNATGKYNVSLTVQTTQGCTSTTTKNSAIVAGDKPVADFSASPLTGCAIILRDFKNKSTGNITASKWDFGDGGISFDKNPQYHYQDTGTFNVKLSVFDNGCKDSIIIPKYIHVDGPVAKMVAHINCNDRFSIKFFDSSIAEVSRLWDFGDGQTSTSPTVVHVYGSPGIYVAKLIITGTSCTDTATETFRIKVNTPVLQITPVKSFYCRYDTVKFSVTNYDTTYIQFFYWHYGDGIVRSGNDDSTTHAYDSLGSFKPFAYLRDNDNCKDTVNFNGIVTINGPTANFTESVPACSNSIVKFNDKSIATGSKITQWLWNYGDGITAATSGSSSYKYAFAGTYNANLKVTDANGCSDSITDTINVFQAPTVDAGVDTFACANSSLTLNPTGASSYVWLSNPGLSCTNCTNPIATPTQSVTYYVTGKSNNGCIASDSVKVAVQTKELITAQPDSYSICSGDSVTLNISGAESYSWLPATSLNNASSQNPIAFPSANTIYTVTGKDSKNCFSDVAMVSVTVNPSPTVNITDSIVQILTGSTYTILASASGDAQNFEWLPPTNLSCNNCLQPVATVDQTTTYTLKATNQFGCSDSDQITIISVCTGESIFLPNTFSPNNDGMNDYFYPRSTADIAIKSLSIFNRWGQLVFQKRDFSSNNATYGWDGKYKNVLQNPDVYVYMMELQCSGKKTVIKKGDISLLR